MGWFLVFRCNPSPRGNRSDNRLAARMDVHMLDGHLLLAFAAMAVEMRCRIENSRSGIVASPLASIRHPARDLQHLLCQLVGELQQPPDV
jgi:hypothetical protein